MLRILGVWNIPPAVRLYLILAVVLLVVGFLINLVASAVKSGPLLIVGTLFVASGAACGLAAALRAGRSPRN
jgi:hypothetical protein